MITPIQRLVALMARLRDPDGGCAWDREQTFATIAPYTIEEAYEVADAIAAEDWPALKDELGDLLFQVVFHSRMAEERGLFAFDDVADAITGKMIRRHPHVFADAAPRDSGDQTRAWEAQKAAERAASSTADGPQRALDGVPLALPALTRAHKIQARAARVGFDWPGPDPVLDKIAEETDELRRAMAGAGGDPADELGDLLFATVNLARKLNVDPEAALRSTISKFERRFRAIEDGLAAEGRAPAPELLDEMERLWQAAKLTEPSKDDP